MTSTSNLILAESASSSALRDLGNASSRRRATIPPSMYAVLADLIPEYLKKSLIFHNDLTPLSPTLETLFFSPGLTLMKV
jgi:hypothetical protein